MQKSRFILLVLIILLTSPVRSYSQEIKDNTQLNFYGIELKLYNTDPGFQKINLHQIESKKQITTKGVISPDKTKIAYTETYFFPQNKQTSSRIYFADLSKINFVNQSKQNVIQILNSQIPLLSKELVLKSGIDSFDDHIFRTLTIIDWSQNSDKLLIKETIGEHLRGIWATNIWIVNVNTLQTRRLDEIRKAISYYWKNKQDLHLNNYRWDILPLGWDRNNPNNIIVNAYGYGYDKKYYLGCWSIDTNGNRSQLLTLEETMCPINSYGYIINNE